MIVTKQTMERKRTEGGRFTQRIILVILGFVLVLHMLIINVRISIPDTSASDAARNLQTTFMGTEKQNSQLNRETLVRDPIHVLYALSGDDPAFLHEAEISLKSVLLNAPLDAELRVHFLCDELAYKGLNGMFNSTRMSSVWQTRNPTTIVTYNVEPLLPQWHKRLRTVMDTRGAEERHTLGTFFRLFVDDVLPNDVHHYIYLDTDVIIIANLAELWSRIDPYAYYQWGLKQCAGFVIFNAKTLRDMWAYWATVDMLENHKEHKDGFNDQSLLRVFQRRFPEKVGILPPRWDVSWGNGIWLHQMDVPAVRPQGGMLHYNGNQGMTLMNNSRVATTFGLGNYYENLPWSWARFMMESQIDHLKEGHPLRLVYNW